MRTTTCVRHGHPEFRLTFDPVAVPVENDVKWFIDWLEQTVAHGTRYVTGQTCQVGWAVTEVRQREDGDLSLWEPDMRHMPFVLSEYVSHTLAHLRLQKDVVESVLDADDVSFPSMCESAVICNRLGHSEGLVMERSKPAGMDSGWYCGCREDDHDHNDVDELRRISLYEAAVRHSPQIVPYLALPTGVLVACSGSTPIIYRDCEPLEFRPGSYLEARHTVR